MGAAAMVVMVVRARFSMSIRLMSMSLTSMRLMGMSLMAVRLMALSMSVVMGVAVPGCHDPYPGERSALTLHLIVGGGAPWRNLVAKS